MAIKNVKILEVFNKSSIRVARKIYFNEKSIQEAQVIFQDLKKKGIILEGNFSDNTWKTVKSLDDGGTSTFSFAMRRHKNLMLPLKVYVVYQLDRASPIRVRSQHGHIKTAIVATNGFDMEELPYIESCIEEIESVHSRAGFAQAVESFAAFMNYDYFEDISEITSLYKTNVFNIRKLINFKDFLKFREIITDFMETANAEERMKYFPIILWWKITNVIPMRTIEFVRVKRNCLSDNNSEKFFITIPRKKKKNELKEKEILDTLPITKNIYDLVDEYIRLTGGDYSDKQLFVYSLGENNFVRTEYFRSLLTSFYNQIVIKKYGERKDIGRIKAMDTRHYAIMSMMFQGCSALTVARMAGHDLLTTQLHYHKHFEEFADSFVFRLTKMKVKRKSGATKGLIAPNDSAIIKGHLYEESKYDFNFKMKPFGICTHNLTKGCMNGGECRSCPAFILPAEEQTLDGFEWMRDYSESLALKLREQIASMQMAVKGMEFKNGKTLKVEEFDWLPNYGEEGLKTLTNNIHSLISQKAEVDAWLVEGDIDE